MWSCGPFSKVYWFLCSGTLKRQTGSIMTTAQKSYLEHMKKLYKHCNSNRNIVYLFSKVYFSGHHMIFLTWTFCRSKVTVLVLVSSEAPTGSYGVPSSLRCAEQGNGDGLETTKELDPYSALNFLFRHRMATMATHIWQHIFSAILSNI